MKDEPIFIIRREVDTVKGLLGGLQDKGILCTVVAPRNTGKTVFFTTIKEEIEETDPRALIIEHEIKRIDNLESFLRDLNMKLQLEINSDVPEATRNLAVSSIQPNLAATGQVNALVPNLETVISSNVMQITNKIPDEPQLLDQFIQLLRRISGLQKADRTIILIDNLDNLENREYKRRFNALFSDIKDKISPGIMVIVASDDRMIESDNVISLPSEFKDYEIEDFITKNFPDINQDLISEIANKTGGYPAALGWLWRTYNPEEDIAHLLRDVSRSGVIAQLQEKFLRGFMQELNDKQKFVFKICGLSPVVDNRIVSHIVGIDTIEAENILKDFKERDIVTVLIPSSVPQIPDFYYMRKPFRIAINTSAFEPDLKAKALTYFADSLLRLAYPPTFNTLIINVILDIFVDLDKTGNFQKLFDFMSINSEDKVILWHLLTSFYLVSANEEKAKQLVGMFPYLSRNIRKENVRNAWQKYPEVINLILSGRTDELTDPLNRIESLLLNEENSPIRLALLTQCKYLKSLFLGNNNLDVDAAINALLESVDLASAPSAISRKLQSILIAWTLGENALGAANFVYAVMCFARMSELIEDLTEEEETEFENYLERAGISVDELASNFEVEMGTAIFLYVASSSDLADQERIELLKESIGLLEQVKTDPVKGDIYQRATRYLEELENNTQDNTS
jgi:hypothetical protein